MFVTVEGIDGSGKTVVSEAIADEYNATLTQEPSDLWTGDALRHSLTDASTDPLTDLYLFLGDRVQHIEETIEPALHNNEFVVCDRYADSTRAYQSVALKEAGYFDESVMVSKIFIEQNMAPWIIEPDKTIYLDVSVDTALDRLGDNDKYNEREFLREVKQNYDELAANEPERFIVVDSEQSKNAVIREAISKLNLPDADRI